MLQILYTIFVSDIERPYVGWWKYIISFAFWFASDVSLTYQILLFAIVVFFFFLRFPPPFLIKESQGKKVQNSQ